MQLIEKVEIFRAGILYSSDGQEDLYTLSDLQEIVDTYDITNHEAPIVISHNNDKNWGRLTTSKSQLANGWVKKLYIDGESLFADIEFDDYTVNCIKEGQLKKRSIGLYPRNAKHNPTPGKYYLRHVAMLGKEPPAVKGLQDIKIYSEMENSNLLNEKAAEWLAFALIDEGNGFNSEIAEIIPEPSEENNWLYDEERAEFAGQFMDTEDRLFDFTLSKNGDNWASAIKMSNVEEEEIEADEEVAEQIEEPMTQIASEEAAVDTTLVDQMANQIKMLEEKLAKLEADKEVELEEKTKEFCDSMYNDGYLTESQIKKDALFQIIVALEKLASTITYSEDKKDKPVVNGIKALLKSFPKQLNFSEPTVARVSKSKPEFVSPYKTGSEESNKQYSEIRHYMEKHNIVNFAEGYKSYKNSIK